VSTLVTECASLRRSRRCHINDRRYRTSIPQTDHSTLEHMCSAARRNPIFPLCLTNHSTLLPLLIRRRKRSSSTRLFHFPLRWGPRRFFSPCALLFRRGLIVLSRLQGPLLASLCCFASEPLLSPASHTSSTRLHPRCSECFAVISYSLPWPHVVLSPQNDIQSDGDVQQR
jgi:hypothetical protein